MERCTFVNNTAASAGALGIGSFLQRDYELDSYWQVTVADCGFEGELDSERGDVLGGP